MDWEHIISLTPESLTDEDKDELHNTIAWYDCESEELDINKFKVLLKLSQEVMKYKGEQVETLLAELDEIATKQAEEQQKKDSDAEVKSLRSKRSHSSLDEEELEIKIKDLKAKIRRQNKINERQAKEIEKCKQQIQSLERDKVYLQNELRNISQDDSQSDISETIRDQHKNLIETVREKNKQISQLLDDMESIENDNVALRGKLTNLRDELSEATKQISHLNNETSASKLLLKEKIEIIDNLNLEIGTLKDEVEELERERENRNKEIEEFTQEIDSRVDEWKKILEDKNNEIKELKLAQNQPVSTSSSVYDHTEYDRAQISAMTAALKDREGKLVELQDQLVTATKEMEESTRFIESLTVERNSNALKIDEQLSMINELQKQLKSAHSRSSELEESVSYIRKKYKSKDKDLQDLIYAMKQEGNVELSQYASTMQELKSQIYMQEKQIQSLVKSCNKLQDTVEHYDLENAALRSRLGISDDEPVIVSGVVARRKKDKKLLQKLQGKINDLEEEKLELRLEILNFTKSSFGSPSKSRKSLEKAEEEKDGKEVEDYQSKYKEMLEENEALRKGLHEVLDSIQAKTGNGKIESATLEKLLKALDVRHISGWYHPAMRLQAELHTLQGVNAEIRNQLQSTRQELNQYKTTQTSEMKELTPFPKLPKVLSANNEEIISNLNMHLMNVLNNYHMEEATNKNLVERLENYNKDFSIVQEQLNILYQQYIDEKEVWTSKEKSFEEKSKQNEEKIEVLTTQLEEITDFKNLPEDDKGKVQKLAEMFESVVVLNRKCLYLENSQQSLLGEINKLRKDLLNAEGAVVKKLCQSEEEKKILKIKIASLENSLKDTIDSQTSVNLQNTLDDLMLKQRDLLHKFDEMKEHHQVEIKHVNENKNALARENVELKTKLSDALCKLHTVEVVTCNLDTSSEVLTKKLAEIEVNEITERQRANHTNNLYELVKEQLRNSEDKFVEFEKFSKELMHKNLSLQEAIKKLEDKVQYYVDVGTFKETQEACAKLLEENEKLVVENAKMAAEVKVLEGDLKNQKQWSSAQEYEFLSLKHQIVDLQSASDDKAVVARLSFDVVHARLSEAEGRKTIENLRNQISTLQSQFEESVKLVEKEKSKCLNVSRYFEEKIRVLQEIILNHRVNYYGFIPYTSESKYIDNLHRIFVDKHATFLTLQKALTQENETNVMKEQVKEQLKLVQELSSSLEEGEVKEKINQWFHEKNTIQLQELKYRRQCEFKESQLQQTIGRISNQDEQIARLEEELLRTFQMNDMLKTLGNKEVPMVPKNNKADKSTSMTKPLDADVVINTSKSSQTDPVVDSSSETTASVAILTNLQTELKESQDLVSAKEKVVQDLKSKITELEMNVSLFRNQLGDKQSQITFYEKYILELQNKKEQVALVAPSDTVDSTDKSSQEMLALKSTISDLQVSLTEKEEAIVEYQSLLKKDRDEHSLAAARMQEEVKRLQNILNSQQQAYKKLQETRMEPQPNKAVIEQYFQQVHALEKHSTDIHIAMRNLNLQLQETKEDVDKWRNLAESRLESLNKIKNNVGTESEKNAIKYKQECEKWKGEVSNLKKLMEEYRNETDGLKPIKEMLREKDQKINELSTTVRQVKSELKRRQESVSSDSTRLSELESENEHLMKELDNVKKRFELLMKREKSAREEIRSLKGQLLKRPLASARSDKSDSTVKEQLLQKKTATLENEVQELKEQLEKQLTINEAHRMKVSEDFDRWSKMKHFQQAADKYKNKLKAKEQEFQKLQHTCNGYRILIERLEREKHTLEGRLKNLRNSCNSVNVARLEKLDLENSRLQAEVEMLTSKLEMQHHHSGGLGAAMLQEKLEAQERKIAVLELSAKQ